MPSHRLAFRWQRRRSRGRDRGRTADLRLLRTQGSKGVLHQTPSKIREVVPWCPIRATPVFARISSSSGPDDSETPQVIAVTCGFVMARARSDRRPSVGRDLFSIGFCRRLRRSCWRPAWIAGELTHFCLKLGRVGERPSDPVESVLR